MSPGEFNINFKYFEDSIVMGKESKMNSKKEIIYEYSPFVSYNLRIFRRSPVSYIKKHFVPLMMLNLFQALIHLSFIDSTTKILTSTCIGIV